MTPPETSDQGNMVSQRQGEWVLVPREPTEAMTDAGWEIDRAAKDRGEPVDAKDVWEAMLSAAPPPEPRADEGGEAFQARVLPWMLECFGPVIPFDKIERADRFIEESVELAQTTPGFTRDRAHALVDYVFDRPVGEPAQEVGGVMVTLAAYCLANGLNMAEAGETELARIWTKVPQIRAKQAAKPTGSALPIAPPPASQSVDGGEG